MNAVFLLKLQDRPDLHIYNLMKILMMLKHFLVTQVNLRK